jgi:branched-subunit amino acid transport protein
MSATTYIITILIAGFATWLTRYPGLLLGRVVHATPRIERGLRYIPIGIFAAMVAPAILLHPLSTHWHIDYPYFIAAFIAIGIAWRTRNPLWTMLAGVITIAVLRAVLM